MEENNISAEPQADANTELAQNTENQTGEVQNEVTIPVKFNKEVKNITAEQAASLAQKGMKFEMIEDEFLKLRNLAAKSKMSVREYINHLENEQSAARREELLEECGGNEALADRVMELESGAPQNDGLEELKEYFPTVKSLDDLPRAVVESARLKGENLLNSYLRFRFIKRRQKAEENLFESAAKNASIGSLKSPDTAVTDTFIKALWGK